ncbi:Cof-type HAD-IIB family hydrolase [Candidatus Stoquefichus sp. SB1]|uniref:Cof-type HAD-IIB family hydrolase n=1 Tax=Candidatus Stoquefichus sp. SB1 TaxID=1658109 RepID=UPI00067E8059|nr:HAD family hydrolase [Candidatus Stoquefichus sp. SB1]
MIKLIATDMDGTFLDSQKNFDKEFIDLFYKMKEKKIKFVIASGNQYYRLYQKFLPLSEQMYFIAENGSYIAQGATELCCDIIQPKTVEKLKYILSKESRIFVVLCGKKGAYILKDYFAYRQEIKKYYCAYAFINSFDEIDDDIMKIAIYDMEHHIEQIIEPIQKQLPDDVKVVTSGNEWMDIQNKNINKGVAIKYLQLLYKITSQECAAFGDQMNDYEMLQEVKYAFAMSNAVKPIQDIAYEVIGSHDEQSVIAKIKELLNEEL